MRSRVIAGLFLVAACAMPKSETVDLAAAARDLSSRLAPDDLTLAGGADLASFDLACSSESDPAFCQRLGKSCEFVSAPDNCGTPRQVNCGSCGGATPACVGNVCRAPVCGTGFQAAGADVASADVAGRQDALLGVSASGGSVLYLQATTNCVGSGAKLLIGDDASGQLAFVSQDISALANLAGFAKSEETMTLSGDGLTLIGVTTTQLFASSTRSGAGKTDFAAPSRFIFDPLNGSLPMGGTLTWPLISADLLAFYYRVDNAGNVNANGIYESVRASTSVPFPAATRMPALVQSYAAISGMSSDRMTAFMATASYGTAILARTSLSAPFATPVPAPSPPSSAFRIMPFAACASLLGTYEPGGCANETMRVWSKL